MDLGQIIDERDKVPRAQLRVNDEGVLVINGQVMETDDVYVKHTGIRERGYGLYANRKFRRGERIVKYDGTPVRLRDLTRKKLTAEEKDYAVDVALPEMAFADADDDNPVVQIIAYPYVREGAVDRIAGFANHRALGGPKKPNAISQKDIVYDRRGEETVEVYLVATRKIAKDRQIYWDYGEAYARRKRWDY